MSKHPRLETPRAFLYHRIGTQEQDPTGDRVQLQRATESHKNLAVCYAIEETAPISRNSRLGLNKLMFFVAKREIEAVLVIRLDRYWRSTLAALSNINILRNSGCRFIATFQGLDIKPDADAMSRLIRTMLSTSPELEKDLIRAVRDH